MMTCQGAIQRLFLPVTEEYNLRMSIYFYNSIKNLSWQLLLG